MPYIPPTKKKPVSSFASDLAAAVNGTTTIDESPIIVAPKTSGFAQDLEQALSKKKDGIADVGNGANTTSSPSTSSSEVQSPSTNIDVPKQYDISSLNGVIQPQGTFVPKPSPVNSILEHLINNPSRSDMVAPTPADTQKQDEVVARRDEAIDNTVQQNLKTKRGNYDKTLPPPTKDEINTEKQFVVDAYKRGDIVPAKEGDKLVMKRTTGFVENVVKGIDEAYKTNQENDYFATLSKDEKIKYLNARQQHPEAFATHNNTATGSNVDLSFGLLHDGLNVDLGQVGQAINSTGTFIGENAAMVAKGTLGAETLGVSSIGSFLALANDFAKGGYKNSYEKTYYALKKQGLSDSEAADKAENVGLVGEATQLGVSGVLSANIGNAAVEAATPAVEGLVEGLTKSVGHLLKDEIPKMSLSSGAASLVESGAQKAVGVDVKLKDALKEGASAAGNGALTALSFWGLHQATKVAASIPSYVLPLFKNVAVSVPVDAREKYLNTAVEQGIMTEPEKIQVSKTINEFGETKKAVSDLPIPEDKKAAITDKLVQAKNIQSEIDWLTPYGASFNDRIVQLTAQKENIHADINKMYVADDVFAHETDNLTGEKPIAEPAVVMPNEVNRPTETTIAPDETKSIGEIEDIPDISNDLKRAKEGGITIEQELQDAIDFQKQHKSQFPTEENVKFRDEKIKEYQDKLDAVNKINESDIQTSSDNWQQGIEQSNTVSNESVASNESKPTETAANQDKQAASQETPLTNEAVSLLSNLDKGSKPAFVTKNLEKIATNNGIEVTDKTKPDDIVNALKEKQNSITSNTNQDAIQKQATTESVLRNERVRRESGLQKVEQNNQSKNIAEEGQPKSKVSRTKASSNLRNLSSKIRQEGLLPNWAKADVPEGTQKMGFGGKELDEAVARSLELVADAIDAGKGLADSVNEGFAHIKDYYEKNTKSFDEKKLKEQFKDNIKSRLRNSGELSGITHAETQSTRDEFGLGGSYEKTSKTDEQLRTDALAEIKNGYNIDKLVSDLEKGKIPSDKETTILKIHKANIEAAIEKNPSDENLAQLRRLVKASDAAGSEQGRALRSRQGFEIRDDSLAGYFTREQDIQGDEPLSEQQKKQVVKEHTEISDAQKKLEEKLAALEKENSRLQAEKKLKEQTAKITNKTKKTKEDFVKERSEILQSIKDKWNSAGKDNMLTAVPVPYSKQLVAIAPDVARLVKSLVEEGVTKLADITKNIHDTLKDNFPEITEKDVQDIIAGEYNPKKPTKSEITQKLSELRAEAKNQNANKSSDASLKAIKARTQTEIKKLEEQLRTGNFEKEIKQPIKLDKETIDLKDKLIKLRQDREIRLMKDEYAKRSKREKAIDTALDVINVPRTLMSSLDYSAPLRQSVVATVAHPHIASKAAVEMFKQSISQKRFDRWFFDLKESPRYKLMEQSGLYVADPHDPRLSLKEEAFTNNMAEKIPLIGGAIKGSERAYVGYLNKMRVDIFNQFADAFESKGYTFENNPEVFKGLASFVNNSTGRGYLGPIESAAPILNSAFFSPRLIASRFNLLGLSDIATLGNGLYGKMPKEVRVAAWKDMAKFVGTGLSVLGLLRLSSWASDCKDAKGEPCLTVEYDPRSTDFGKIKSGNTRWDIWGGMQQYIRVISQVLITGQTKSTNSGKIQELNGGGIFGKTRGDVAGAFVRGKLAPIPSMAMDALTGRTATGEKVSLKDEALQHLLPLLATDMQDAIKDGGIKAILTVGVPSTFGVGVSTYLPRGYENVDIKKDPVFKFLYERNLQLSPPTLTNIPENKTEAFIGKRQEIFKKEWHNVLEYGAMIDRKGNPTTDVRKGVKIKPKDALTYDDLAGLMKSISTKSARRAKKALGIQTD